MELKENNRLFRQYGLVNQDKLSGLRLLILGDGPELAFLIANLAYLGISINGNIDIVEMEKQKYANCYTHLFLENKSDSSKSSFFDECNKIIREIDNRITLNKLLDFDLSDNMYLYDYVFVSISNTAILTKITNIQLPNEKIILSKVTNTAAWIGSKEISSDTLSINTLSPALSCVCGGFAVQELLRRTRSVRIFPISKKFLSFNIQIKGSAGFYKKNYDLILNNKLLPYEMVIKKGNERLSPLKVDMVRSISEEKGYFDDEINLRFEFPEENLLTRFIMENIQLIEKQFIPEYYKPINNFLFSPFRNTKITDDGGHISEDENDIKLVSKPIINKKLFQVGIGGTGSWMAALFAASKPQNCELILVDSDDTIEIHNLNRQLLFSNNDIGKPKVYVAKNKLSQIFPNLTVTTYKQRVGINSALWHMEPNNFNDEFISIYKQYKNNEKSLDDDIYQSDFFEKALLYETSKTDLILSCVDNRYSRYILNILSKLNQTLYINSGAAEFFGNIDIFDSRQKLDTECYVCRYSEEVKQDKTKESCTGPVPILSIVTTTSIIGGMQATISLAALLESNNESKSNNINNIYNHIFYNGKYNSISYFKDNININDKVKDNCPAHLNLTNIKIFKEEDINAR